ncbi:MAG: lactonase family protein [Bradymonadaceae bacterium]|nr:lactonase family protein [Lujinxingiaceae bacterium]
MFKTARSTLIVLVSVLGIACGSDVPDRADTGPGTTDSGADADTSVLDASTADAPSSDTTDVASNIPDALADLGHGEDVPPDTSVEPVVQDVIVGQGNGTLSAYAFDAQTGALSLRDTDTSATQLSFVAFHPTRAILYAASQSTVRAYSYEENKLAYLAAASAKDGGTHVEVDQSGRYVFSASYGGHSLSMLPLDDDGLPGNSILDLGGSNDASFCRNAHQVRVHPSNRFVYIPCLGSNHIRMLAFDADGGTLTDLGAEAVPAGSGPRHMDFHPSAPYAYVINELASTVTIFSVNEDTGVLSALETVSALPQGVSEFSRSSDIHVSPDGRHVYAVHREPLNHIVIFEVQGAGLHKLGQVSGHGEHARSFAIDAGGNFLLLANRNTSDLVSFERNQATGALAKIASLDFPNGLMFVGFWSRP